MNELNRKIDHEPEGNIGVLYLILFFFLTYTDNSHHLMEGNSRERNCAT